MSEANGTARLQLQSWLTPILLGISVTILLAMWNDVRGTQAAVQQALIKLEKHATVLELNGLMEPKPRSDPP